MKKIRNLVLLLMIFLMLALPATALAGGIVQDRIIFGDNFTLVSGDTLDGNLVVLGGNVTLETGSLVDGDVVVMGGNLSGAGEVSGSVIGLGGLISLEDTAVIQGDVTVIGGNLDQADGARVEGDVITPEDGPISLTFPGGLTVPAVHVRELPFLSGLGFLGFIVKIFLWAALAVLAALFAPVHTQRVSRTAFSQPLISGGLGLLTIVVLIPLLPLLAITIILLPVSIVVAAVAALAWIYGLLAIGTELGRRLAESSKQEWAPALSAAVGTFILMLVLDGASMLVDCVGWIFPFLAGIVGLGAVLLTRFGMYSYPAPARALAPAWPPASPPPAPPVPPASPAITEPFPDEPDPLARDLGEADAGDSGGPEG